MNDQYAQYERLIYRAGSLYNLLRELAKTNIHQGEQRR